ncbi:hypothetical protein F2Q69_00052429 [Brassica cretica]|uniref:ABC transmembrane type-1 domain-containing protein n=1 Tax=Brassica cretica TaxID=69181 RepID=A0A8S9NAK0_BRACR|nr:hypothetical protein F2Q69_00052429 [Brassica cretica]
MVDVSSFETSHVHSRSPTQSEMKKGIIEEKARTVPFYKLFSISDSTDVLLMIVGSIGAIGNGLGFPLMTLLFGDLIDTVGRNLFTNDIVELISKICLKFVYLGLGTFVAAFLQVYCWVITGERQAARIRSLYLKTILRQDIVFFDVETNTGEVVGRMSGDTVLILDAMGEKVGKFIQLFVTFLGGYALAFVKGWLLTLVMLTSIPLLAMAGAATSLIFTKASSQQQAAYAKASTIAEQTCGSIRTVASFTGEKQATSSYKELINSAYKSSVKQEMILRKGYTGGAVINVMIIVVASSMSLGQAAPCLTSFAASQAAAYKMFETIKRKPVIDSFDLNGKVLEDIQGEIELRDVCFSYPARPREEVFGGFSLMIPSGKTTALVGESGSGKSTVISLIERFYDPNSGQVLIDGVDLKEFQLKWIRGKIGLVGQEPVLFSSSILENIGYGKEGARVQEIEAAAKLANAAKFIDKLPWGLETMMKRQVLLMQNPNEWFNRVMVNRTTVIVAHRLSTVRNADMIDVLHRGKIVEEGSHLELLKDHEGAYSQLIRLQEINTESRRLEISNGQQDGSIRNESSRGNSVSRMHDDDGSVSVLGLLAGQENTEKPKGMPQDVSIARIAALNKPEAPILILGTLVCALDGAIFPIFGLLFAKVIIAFWSIIFVLLGVLSLVVYPIHMSLFAVAGGILIRRIRSMCFEKVVHMEVGWFDEPENSSGAMGARFSADAALIRTLVRLFGSNCQELCIRSGGNNHSFCD